MRDPLYADAVKVVRTAGRARTALLQQHLGIGYSRAVLLIDQMEADHVIGPYRAPFDYREVLTATNLNSPAFNDEGQGDLFI